MKILDRYMVVNYVLIFLFSMVLLYVLFVIGDIFGFLDEILREHIGLDNLVRFYAYMAPFVVTQIAPIASLMACVFMLGNLNMHSEITALKASGISLLKILKPLLITGLVITAVLFVINDKIVPKFMRLANKVRFEKLEIGKRGASTIINNIAMYGEVNKIIFVRKFNVSENTLEEVIIHEEDESHKIVSKVSIKKMTWRDNKWYGDEIVTYRVNKLGEFISAPEMNERGIINIKETPLEFINNQWQPQYMSYGQLRKYLKVFLAGSKIAQRRFSVDLAYKLAFPFAPIAMILIAAPFTLVTKRGGALFGVAQGLLIGLTYIPLVAVGLALGRGGSINPTLAAWLPNIVLGGIGLYFTLKK